MYMQGLFPTFYRLGKGLLTATLNTHIPSWNKVCCPAQQNNTPPPHPRVPSHIESECYCQYMPTLLYLVWQLEIVNEHTQFGYKEIIDTEDMKHIKFNKVLNVHSDLDLEKNNLVFTQNVPEYDNVPPT